MENYQVTIGYKAIITVSVKANSEQEAKDLALKKFEIQKDKMFKTDHVFLEDDNFKADGVLNMDETWNQF